MRFSPKLTRHTNFSIINQQRTNTIINNRPTLSSRYQRDEFNAVKIILIGVVDVAGKYPKYCRRYSDRVARAITITNPQRMASYINISSTYTLI